MDPATFVIGASAYRECKLRLRDNAQTLLWHHIPARPPYDPFLIARLMQVVVETQPISGLDGYVEVVNGRYFAVISSLTNQRRQRFTLAHELGHVLFMRQAEKGSPAPLVRYRANGCPPGLHQDPVEESLCNEFASELLLPTSQVRTEVVTTKDPVTTVLRLSETFDVSLQAAAKRIVRILGANRVGCALWKNSERKMWPMPLWCEGIRTDFRAQLLEIEALISDCAKSQMATVRVFESFGKNRIKAEVRVHPLGKNHSLVIATAPEKKRNTCAFEVIDHIRPRREQTECQLSFFDQIQKDLERQN